MSSLYQIDGYSNNSVTFVSGVDDTHSRVPSTRLTMKSTDMDHFMLGKIMAAQEVFRERGPHIAYPFIASELMLEPNYFEPNTNRPPRFTVGDRFAVSCLGTAFVSILGFSLYNTLIALNKMFLLQDRSREPNVVVMNSVGLGDYLLNKIRELPNGSERQELVGVMVYLVTNGFFTAERIHELYQDVEADISFARENGIEHQNILPYPHMDAAPFDHARQPNGEPISPFYQPVTDNPGPDETLLFLRIGPENCIYKPEFFRASQYNPFTRTLTDRVTDKEIKINQDITALIISRMNRHTPK